MSLLDWVYPLRCISCRTIFPPVYNKPREWLCRECEPLLKFMADDFCTRCGHPRLPLAEEEPEVFDKNLVSCRSCYGKQFNFKSHRAAFAYEDVIRELIHNAKFRSQRQIMDGLGHLMAVAFSNEYPTPPHLVSDYLVPIPLHKSKKRSRGFNQAALLAYPISKLFNIPVAESMIKRIVKTVPQSGLNAFEREQNLIDAFEYDDKKFSAKNKKIILIDDIFTSGSTVNTCAKILMENGAAEVNCVSLSIAIRKFDEPLA